MRVYNVLIAVASGAVAFLTLGAIGVSGASAEEDEMCAKAGIDAIADMLK